MGRRCGNRVHCLIGNIHHGFRTGQSAVAREGALFVVELALLPLVKLPHRVIPHGPPFLFCSRSDGFVASGRGYAADTFRPGLAVSGECSITFRIAGHNLGSVAWHISW